jgi:hypothetical protein
MVVRVELFLVFAGLMSPTGNRARHKSKKKPS